MAIIKTIVVPANLNLDTLLALWLLRRFGAKAFKGCATATVTSRKSTSALYPTDFLLTSESIGTQEKMPESILARCGCTADADLQNLLFYLRSATGQGFVMLLENIVQTNTMAKAIAWSAQAFDALYGNQSEEKLIAQNSTLAAEEMLAAAVRLGKVPRERTITIRRQDGMNARVGFVISSIQVFPAGPYNILVSFNPEYRSVCIASSFSIRDVIRILRVEEIMHGSRDLLKDPQAIGRIWFELAGEGEHKYAPQWSYRKVGDEDKHHHVITSGWETPLTALSIHDIVQLIRVAVNDRFHPQREHYCKKFFCTSRADFPCPWAHYSLSKCRMIQQTGIGERELRRGKS